jgi:hypothetical protein
MTSPKPDDASIPLTDDLGDTRALLAPERDPVTGARVAGALQRAAKHTPIAAARPSPTTPRHRPRWPVPVGVGAVVLVGAVFAFVATRRHSTTSDTRATPATQAVTANAPITTTTAARRAGPAGPLVGFDGTYQITAENVHISGSSGGFASARLERSGTTVIARYDGDGGSGTATVELPEGPATITCAADGWTCTMQWTGTIPVVLDGSLGRAVLQRADGTPLGRSECNLPIASDGSVIPQFGLVNKQPQVQHFRIATGTASGSSDGCANAVVIAYDLVANRAP